MTCKQQNCIVNSMENGQTSESTSPTTSSSSEAASSSASTTSKSSSTTPEASPPAASTSAASKSAWNKPKSKAELDQYSLKKQAQSHHKVLIQTMTRLTMYVDKNQSITSTTTTSSSSTSSWWTLFTGWPGEESLKWKELHWIYVKLNKKLHVTHNVVHKGKYTHECKWRILYLLQFLEWRCLHVIREFDRKILQEWVKEWIQFWCNNVITFLVMDMFWPQIVAEGKQKGYKVSQLAEDLVHLPYLLLVLQVDRGVEVGNLVLFCCTFNNDVIFTWMYKLSHSCGARRQ